MNPTSRTRRAATAGAWIAAGAIGATAVTGLAAAAPPTSSGVAAATTASGASADTVAATREPTRVRLRDVLHGTLTIQGADGPTAVDVQRGRVTAASASSVTVVSSDGFSATYAVGPDTLVRRDRATVAADALVVGDTAVVRADGTTATAVRALSAATLATLKDRLAGLGTGRAGGRLGGLLGGAGGTR